MDSEGNDDKRDSPFITGPSGHGNINNRPGKICDYAPFKVQKLRSILWSLLIISVLFSLISYSPYSNSKSTRVHIAPQNAIEIIDRCRSLSLTPTVHPGFYSRRESDRYDEASTKSTLVYNATIWTGNDNGKEILRGAAILLERGIIKWIGRGSRLDEFDAIYLNQLERINVNGAWITPGLVDIHSHLGLFSIPSLSGSDGTGSPKSPILPYLRALDNLNTHDDGYKLSVAGGVTSALVLTGSGNAISGQGYPIKLRPTKERTPSSMLLEPPLNTSSENASSQLRWRHMKHACGENPSNLFQQTRMDTIWQFREIYNRARILRDRQDAFCAKAESDQWDTLYREFISESKLEGTSMSTSPLAFPDDLELEAVVDVLRGRVKVQTHCYESVDLDAFVRLSNEFQFPIAAFHHAMETYLVPDILKKAYGPTPPASALFGTFARVKREMSRHSVFAPKILDEEGLRVIMKSDHPAAINSRYLLHEAQQAFYYGLPWNVALRSVISTPADVMGVDYRVGYIKLGYDADIAIWDSHPLALGSTPHQVYIDGIAQLPHPQRSENTNTYNFIPPKPPAYQMLPNVPNFDKEAREAVEWEGVPPLEPTSVIGVGADTDSETDTIVVFRNVKEVYIRNVNGEQYGIEEVFNAFSEDNDIISHASKLDSGIVLVKNGKIICYGFNISCQQYLPSFTSPSSKSNTTLVEIDLRHGSISPSLTTFGSQLGLAELGAERSTRDGEVFDYLSYNAQESELTKEFQIIRAVDGVMFGTRNALIANRAGVTTAITAPSSSGFLSGLSVAFSTGANHALEKGAILQDVVALHVTIAHGGAASVSTQIAALRKLLLGSVNGETRTLFRSVVIGTIPLIVTAHNADIIASLINLKSDIESYLKKNAHIKTDIKLVINGASEAHLLARELGEAGVGVILTPPRPIPLNWDDKRILLGPPLTNDTSLTRLLAHNVTVAIGVMMTGLEPEISGWAAQNLRFDIGWAALDSKLSKTQALALGSTNIEKLLGLHHDIAMEGDLVVTQGGGLLDFESKVIGVINQRRGEIQLFS